MATMIFDFDDTLFDTAKLKETIFNKFEEFELDKVLIEKTYQESQQTYNNYSLHNHIKVLEEKYNYTVPSAMNEWLANLDFKPYLFNNTFDILKKFSTDHYLVLLTKGDIEFQKSKLISSEIEEYFKKVYIIEGSKESFLKDNIFEKPVYFINDKESENKIIKELFPDFIIIQKKKGEPLKFSLEAIL